MSSGLALKADIARYSRDVSKVPGTDMASTIALAPSADRRCKAS